MALSLKIFIQAHNQQKTMRFMQDMSVGECLKEIKEKTNVGGADHGLFQVAQGEVGARWLKENRTLQYYSLSSNSELHYRKKHHPLKVKLLDGTVKTILADWTLTVGEMVEVVASKISLASPEEYSFMAETGEGILHFGRDLPITEWLNSNMMLEEQGIQPDATVLLKKKFFFRDDLVDRDNPVALHLLFVQSQDSIINGLHPTTKNEARDLAALQAQILNGNYNPEKHESGYLEPKEYYPIQYQKDKLIEKETIKEWRKLVGMTDVNAKYRYIQLCRSLKTWGITSFPVAVVDKTNKKKLHKFLLGVTRESILFLDAETKEITNTWPLTRLKRYAAATNKKTFTLDFGNYEENYIQLMTDEPDKIVQLIGGYIDIILKSRKEANKFVEAEDNQVAKVEEVSRNGAYAYGSIASSWNGPASSTSQSMVYGGGGGRSMSRSVVKPTVVDLNTAVQSLSALTVELSDGGAHKVPSAMSQEQWNQQLFSELPKLSSSTSALYKLANSKHIERDVLDTQSKQIAMEAERIVVAARGAALMGKPTNYGLISAARTVADALKSMLLVAGTMCENPQKIETMKQALAVAHGASEASQLFLQEALKGNMADVTSQELISESSRSLSSCVQALIEETRKVAETIHDEPKKAILLSNINTLSMTADMVSSTAITLSPGAVLDQVRVQIKSASNAVAKDASNLMATARTCIDMTLLPNLFSIAKEVSEAITQLVDATQCAESDIAELPDIQQQYRQLQVGIESMRQAGSNKNAIISSARTITLATNNIINATKTVSNAADPETKKSLLAAARLTADAITTLVNSAKEATSNPTDPVTQNNLMSNCKKLEANSQQLFEESARLVAMAKVRKQSKDAAAVSSTLIAQARAAKSDIGDATTQGQILVACKAAADGISHLVKTLKTAGADNKNPKLQQDLLQMAQEASVPGMGLVAQVKRVLPKIIDLEKKSDLKLSCDRVTESFTTLMEVCKIAQSGGVADVQEALDQLAATVTELESSEFAVQSGVLAPVYGQSRDDALALIDMAMKQLGTSTDILKEISISAPKQLGPAAKEMTLAISQVATAARAVASQNSDKMMQSKILSASKELTNDTKTTMTIAKDLVENPSPSLERTLLESAQKLASAMANLAAVCRGFDSSILDEAVRNIKEGIPTIEFENQVSGKSFQESLDDLTMATKALSGATSQAVAMAKSNPKNLSSAAKITSSSVVPFILAAKTCSFLASTPIQRDQLVGDSKEVLEKTVTLLEYAKVTAAHKDSTTDLQLTRAAKMLADAMDNLLRSLGYGSNRQCEEALETIMAGTNILSEPTLPSKRNMLECLDELTTGVKALANSTSHMVHACRGTPEQLGRSALDTANNITSIIKTATETAGADTGPPVPREYAEHANIIYDSCKLITESVDLQTLFVAARNIAGSTAGLLNIAKREAGSVPDMSQQKILRAARVLRESTTQLANAAKSVQMKSPGAQGDLFKAGRDLSHATQDLISFLLPESNQSYVNAESVQKLLDSVRVVSTATAQLITASSEVSNKPKDTAAQNQLSTSTSAVTNAIVSLLNLASTLQPASAEYEAALESIQTSSGELDSSMLSVAVGTFERIPTDKSHQDCQENLVQVSRDIHAAINELLVSTRTESPETIAKSCSQLASQVEILVKASRAAASTTTDQEMQNSLLQSAKDIADAMLELVNAGKTCGTNPTKENQRELGNKVKDGAAAISALVSSLSSGVSLFRDIDEALAVIDKASRGILNPVRKEASMDYQTAKDQISDTSKILAACLKRLVTLDKNNVIQLGEASKQVADNIPLIVEASRAAATLASSSPIKENILYSCTDLANAARIVVAISKDIAADPKNKSSQQKLMESFKSVTQSLPKLLEAVKQGAVGEMMFDEASDSLTQIIADVDAASLFAAAGQLEQDLPPGVTASEVKNNLISNAKQTAAASSQLVHQLKTGKVTQEQFGAMVKSVASAVAKLAENTKASCALMGDLKAQQHLLSATKAATISSQQLIMAGKDALRYKEDGNIQKALLKGAESVAESISGVISLTQSTEAELAQGIQEITTAKVELQTLLGKYDNDFNPPDANPEEIVTAARGLAGASAQLSSSNGNQESIVIAVKAAKAACQELLEKSKGASRTTSDPSIENAVNEAAKLTVCNMCSLLDAVKDHSKTGLAANAISTSSTAVADGISELILVGRNLPGGSSMQLEDDTSTDLEEVASNELAHAAKAIQESAAALLAARRPKKDASISMDTWDVTGAILDAALAIANATQNLVIAASKAQNERVDKQKQNPSVYRKDPMWANGLISAAKNVAGATQKLVSSANGAVQGSVQEEELVVVARAVAAATAQLVSASRAKADPESKGLQNLQAAAKTVALATSQIVSAAKAYTEAAEQEEEEEERAATYTGTAVKQLEQQMRIAKLEKELEKARKSMFESRKKEYQKK